MDLASYALYIITITQNLFSPKLLFCVCKYINLWIHCGCVVMFSLLDQKLNQWPWRKWCGWSYAWLLPVLVLLVVTWLDLMFALLIWVSYLLVLCGFFVMVVNLENLVWRQNWPSMLMSCLSLKGKDVWIRSYICRNEQIGNWWIKQLLMIVCHIKMFWWCSKTASVLSFSGVSTWLSNYLLNDSFSIHDIHIFNSQNRFPVSFPWGL